MFPLGYIPKTAGQGRSMWCQYLISVFEYFLKWFCRFTLPAMVPSLPYHLLVGFYWLKQFSWCFGASYISLLRGRSTSASWALILPILAPPVRIVYSYKLSLLGFCLICKWTHRGTHTKPNQKEKKKQTTKPFRSQAKTN